MTEEDRFLRNSRSSAGDVPEPWVDWQSSYDCLKEANRLKQLRDLADKEIEGLRKRATELIKEGK